MSNKIESGGMSESSGIELKGDFVRLVWLIEKLRRRDGGCTMNYLIFECKERFCGLEFIKESKMENNPQAPSATVDEMREKMANCIATYCDKRVRDGDFDFFDAEVYIGELLKYLISDLHSQQEKRYTAQQMKDFAFDYHVGKYIRDTDKALDQFKSERGIK